MKQERYYQTDAINAVGRNLLEKNISKQMLVLATGTGKTFLASKIAKKKVFRRILWLTHTEELIQQSALALAKEFFDGEDKIIDFMNSINEYGGIIELYNHLDKIGPGGIDMYLQEAVKLKEMIGIVKQKRFDIDSKIVVASIQTMHRRLDRIDPNHFDLVICDEAHLFGASTFVKCLDHFQPKLRLGLTATPKRSDNFGLGNIFDEIAYEYPILKGIEDKYLCEIDAIKVQTELNLDDVRTTAGELNQKDLRVIDCTPRNNLIVDKYLEYAEGRQTIIFCVDVEHVQNLCKTFNNRGIKADFVVGDKTICPDRKERIERYKRGEVQVLCNVFVLVAGFDHPDTSCIIMACPTKSETKFIQSLGRGTRLKSKEFQDKFGRNDMILLDILDNTSRHHLVNSYTLDKGKKAKDRVFMIAKAKEALIEKEKREFQGTLKKKDERVDLKPIPKIKVKKAAWMNEPATAKQVDWLKKAGFDIEETTFTKGIAAEYIGNLPATHNQIVALKKWRYNVPDNLTRAQAQACFAEIEKNNGRTQKAQQYYDKKEKSLPFNDLK